MDAERIAVAKKVLEHNWRFNVPPAMQYLDASQYIESLEQQVESLKLSLSNNELQIGELRKERDAWIETAQQHCRNEAYYRGLVVQIGEAIGEAAYISDDGSKQQDVLCAKVPELAIAAIKERDAALAEAAELSKLVERAVPAMRLVFQRRGSAHENNAQANLALVMQDMNELLAARRAGGA